ncbi:Cyclin, N-terminal domain containing protein [Trichomonas vaginalis G3]|uniref:Cyclin, N-terminal domain containing protein n=1 Tax=Trichomonas vaginalis (strain ATCC PRA-98 / G3) TaxID=412133 RepID=A2E2Z3_TRIV3|nr:cell division [Trichomonas vaginalis G3]EAY12929.1 Cyclin, N-terminal domain containing protein [Trichomonas vaginalis G3]KAI5499733.1 cell division [Trichomonas vaginalis G3]|eukprot:XP_001325152.1 Cyclin, N-terminal domain containing protein [Trichomonas vaginalis G3]
MDLSILDHIQPLFNLEFVSRSSGSDQSEPSDDYSFDYSINLEDDFKNCPSKTPFEYVPHAIVNISKHRQEIRENYNQHFHEIKKDIKVIIVDWCIRVYLEMSLSKETLFLGIYILNTILRIKSVKRCHLQLVAATSLWIASKIEEASTPTLSDFVTVCGNNYSTREFYACEKCILRYMNYDIAIATHQFYIDLALGTFDASESYKMSVEIISLVSLFLDDLTDSPNIASAILSLAASISHENDSIWKLSFPINEPSVMILVSQLSDNFKEQLAFKNSIISKKFKTMNDSICRNNAI